MVNNARAATINFFFIESKWFWLILSVKRFPKIGRCFKNGRKFCDHKLLSPNASLKPEILAAFFLSIGLFLVVKVIVAVLKELHQLPVLYNFKNLRLCNCHRLVLYFTFLTVYF
jgi:hypothetical protein